MTEYNQKNADNYGVASRFKVWIARWNSTTSAYEDYRSVGNVVDTSLAPTFERLKHNTHYRGIDKQDQSIVVSTEFTGKVTIDELVKDNMLYVLMSTIRTTAQTYYVPDQENKTWAGGAGSTVEVNGGDAIYQVLNVWHLSNDTAYEEGATADYTVTEATGTLTKTAGSTIADGEEVLIDYETSETCVMYNILDSTDIKARMKIVSENTTGPKHCIFLPYVKLSLDGEIPFPKDAWLQATLNLEIMEDDTYGYGQWYTF